MLHTGGVTYPSSRQAGAGPDSNGNGKQSGIFQRRTPPRAKPQISFVLYVHNCSSSCRLVPTSTFRLEWRSVIVHALNQRLFSSNQIVPEVSSVAEAISTGRSSAIEEVLKNMSEREAIRELSGPANARVTPILLAARESGEMFSVLLKLMEDNMTETQVRFPEVFWKEGAASTVMFHSCFTISAKCLRVKTTRPVIGGSRTSSRLSCSSGLLRWLAEQRRLPFLKWKGSASATRL